MTTTSPIVTSDPTSWMAAAATGDIIPCPVTPEALMAMLQIRLRDSDSQLSDAMATLNNNTANASKLSQLLQALNQLKQIGSQYAIHMTHDHDHVTNDDIQPGEYMDGSGDIADGSTHSADAQTTTDAIAAVNAQLEAIGVAPLSVSHTKAPNADGTYPSDDETYWKATDVQGAIDNVTQHLRDANSGNDQLMVQVQSLTQSRTTNIQMITNMLKASNDSLSAIVQNMR